MIRNVLHFVFLYIISSLLSVSDGLFRFFRNKIREKVSIIFNYLEMNISSDCVELHTSKSFQYSFISDISKIGCFIYLLVFFKTESTFLFDSTRNGLFKFWNLETCSVSEMISPLHNVTLSLVIILFEKFFLANCQKYWLTFKEAYSFFSFWSINETQQLLCF